MRGYKTLKELNELERIKLIKEELALTSIFKGENLASELIFGAGLKHSDLIIRQYLMSRVVNLKFNESLLIAIGSPKKKHTFLLPPEWLVILKKQGVRISLFWSAVHWNIFLLKMIAYGFFKFCQVLFESVSLLFRENHRYGRYVFFINIEQNNLPLSEKSFNNYDVVSWYWEKFGRSKNLDRVAHSAKGTGSSFVNGIQTEKFQSPLPPLESLYLVIKLLAWFIKALIFVFIDLFIGRWWTPLIFGESVLATKARINSQDSFAIEYLFHNSGPIYRPLWTYEAKKKGAEISLYFYSTNNETFKKPEGYSLQANNWNLINWPNYLVWDNYQALFIEKFTQSNTNISVVGKIWFSSSIEEIQLLPKCSVAVFDVQPVRDAFYNILGLDFDYYTPLVCNQFISDISEVILQNDCFLIHKRKRKAGKKFFHHKYINLLQKLEKSSHFIKIDEDVSAQKVINNCLAVISMPFTSAALMAKMSGKPSIFYDPCGLIQKDDVAAHGIRVICGSKELNDWLLSVLNDYIYPQLHQ